MGNLVDLFVHLHSPTPTLQPLTFFFFFEGIWHTSQTVSTTEGEINEMVVVVVT